MIPPKLLGLLVMAAMTWLIRAGGFWMMARVPLTPRVRRMLDALPGSIVAATVLPIVSKSGSAAVIAIAAAVLIMRLHRNALLAVACGMAVAALARSVGL
jgi:uncharacterized membrane protein